MSAARQFQWETRWKLDAVYYHPVQVRVVRITSDHVLEEGEDHPKWKGNYFATPAAAFAKVQDDIDRSRRHDDDRQKRLDAAWRKHRAEQGEA